MAFTRDDLKTYEAKPQVQVPDNTSPFKQAAAPAAAAAPSADEPDDELIDDTDDDASPSDVADVTAPDVQGDGTSDVSQEDPSTSDSAAPSGDTENSDEPPAVTQQQAPKKNSARARIQELVEERDGYRAYGEYSQERMQALEKELAELRKQVGSSASKPAATPAPDAPDEPLPTMADPDVNYDPDAFNRKLLAHIDRRTEKQVKKVLATVTPPPAAAPENDPVKKFNERLAKYAGEHKDFEPLVKTLPQFSQPVSTVIVTNEDGVEVLHHLARHKAEAVRIARLDPAEQLMEIGVIRAKIRASKGPNVLPPKGQEPPQGAVKTPAKPKSPSNAPPPPTRIPAGGRAQADDVTSPSMTMADFAARHRAEKNAAREQSRKLRGLR